MVKFLSISTNFPNTLVSLDINIAGVECEFLIIESETQSQCSVIYD